MDRKAYTVAIVCHLPIENEALRLMLDKEHTAPPKMRSDSNQYVCGKIAHHNVVIASRPTDHTPIVSAATLAPNLENSFPCLTKRLAVGVGGGAPHLEGSRPKDIRLGDIVVSTPNGSWPGVVHYDAGKVIQTTQGRTFQWTRSLHPPPADLLAVVTRLERSHSALRQRIGAGSQRITQANKAFRNPKSTGKEDILVKPGYAHRRPSEACDRECRSHAIKRSKRDSDHPDIFYGTVGSAHVLIRNGEVRDGVRQKYDVICFDNETGGLSLYQNYLYVRGICDYADSHTTENWRAYAAVNAASYARELLVEVR